MKVGKQLLCLVGRKWRHGVTSGDCGDRKCGAADQVGTRKVQGMWQRRQAVLRVEVAQTTGLEWLPVLDVEDVAVIAGWCR